MRMILVVAAIAAVAISPAFAKSAAQTASQNNMTSCSASWKTMSAADKKATTRKAYMSTCMTKSSGSAAAPASSSMAAAPAMATQAKASGSGGTMSNCASSWKGKSDTDKKATTYKAFMSGCMKGTGTASAASMTKPAATTAAPAAMTASTKQAASAKPATAMKTAAKSSGAKSAIPTEGDTGTSARCKDGQIIAIKSHAGACSHHGGVAAWR